MASGSAKAARAPPGASGGRRHAAEKPIDDLRSRVVKELERLSFSDARDLVQWDRRPVHDAEANMTGFEDVLVPTPSHKLKRDVLLRR